MSISTAMNDAGIIDAGGLAARWWPSHVWSSIADVEPLRRDPAEVAVLLNRTVANASSTEMMREAIAAGTGGWPARRVLEATVPRREALARAFGADPAPGGPYAAVVDELDRVEATA